VRREGAAGRRKRRWPGGRDGAVQTALARRARRRGAAGACLGVGRLAPAAVAGTACCLEVVRRAVEARLGVQACVLVVVRPPWPWVSLPDRDLAGSLILRGGRGDGAGGG
jgi:hypothetical protein